MDIGIWTADGDLIVLVYIEMPSVSNMVRNYEHVVDHKSTYFVKGHSEVKISPQKTTLFEFLIDNIFVESCGVIRIPTGIYCAPVLANLFLYSYLICIIWEVLLAIAR